MKLLTDVQLAEDMSLTLEKFHDLRKRKHWPCVRLGRFEYRFTPAQVDEIVRMHTEATGKPNKTATSGKGKVPGQTARSASRSS